MREDPRDFVPVTPSEINRVLGPLSRSTLKNLGQHFLSDRNLRDALIRDAKIQENEIILEVGTGLGIFTAGMLAEGARVVSVEIDKMMFTLARQFLDSFDNLIQLNDETLEKNSLSKKVTEALENEINLNPDAPLRLVANLPFNIATKVIQAVLEWSSSTGKKFDGIAAMVQKEVAQRITAKPGVKDFAYFTVLCNVYGEFERGRLVKKYVFYPPPKVESMMIHATLTRKNLMRIKDYEYFKQVLHNLFLHRRKYALKSLTFGVSDEHKELCKEAYFSLGLPERNRPEDMPVEKIIVLVNELYERDVKLR